MKLIITSSEFEKEFKRLINEYKKFYWASAWAGVSSSAFKELLSKKDKIAKIIVGTHFYQTHPDFIETFLENNAVRFIKQPQGIFHPKLYLFYNNTKKWEILIGSANFTNEAFTRNTEATTLINSNDNNTENILETAFVLIEKSWSEANKFTKMELDKYHIAWKNHRPKIDSLSGQYGGSKKPSKPIHEVPATTMTWKEYVKQIREEESHGLEERLKVIETAQKLFRLKEHFKDLKDDERKFIAGVTTNYADDWGYFGSMKGNGKFVNKIKINCKNISDALDEIPLSGQITKTHYDNFKKHFSKALEGNPIGSFTRLLAMKRPDTFVCFDGKNKSNLCKEFGIQQSGMTYERYWTDIIERIFDSEWWFNPDPKNKQEERISASRAAFLDALYYEA